MSKFKAGDRVRVVATYAQVGTFRGREGTVVPGARRSSSVAVSFMSGDPLLFAEEELELVEAVSDPVDHPDHYTWLPVEAIEITECFNFNMGNALKYVMRADRKGSPEQDIAKAIWYLRRELGRRAASVNVVSQQGDAS